MSERPSFTARLLRPIVQLREGESTTALLMFLYSFLAMTSYNIIKPITRSQFISSLGVDNLPGARPLETYDLPRACVLLFGQEGPGLSDDARAACDATLSIAQFGSTRSINASAAAAIAMHSWVRLHAT